MAEHRADVVELLKRAHLVEIGLEIGADHRGGGFRPERQALVPFADDIHLLLDHVGGLADAPDEEAGELEDGGADFAVAPASEDLAGGGLESLPERGLGGQDVLCAQGSLQLHHESPEWKQREGRQLPPKPRPSRGHTV